MLRDSAWENLFNKSEIKLSSAETDWKNFMNECLIETETFKKNKNESEKCLQVDPNFVMDVRHIMVKQSTKIIPVSKISIHAEALKLLRMENHNKLIKQKEKKLVEKEIAKLKQILEDYHLLTNKKINETKNKKLKFLSNGGKFSKHKSIWKRLEANSEHNLDICQSVQITIGSKISQNTRVIYDAEVQSSQEECLNEFLEPVSSQKGSPIESESECENQFQKVEEDKNEIMKRFFRNYVMKTEQCSTKPEVIRNNPEEKNLANQKIMEQAWCTWKAYTQKLKNEKRKKAIYQNKIESFLLKFKENKMNEEKHVMNHKLETRKNLILKNRKKIREEQLNDKEKEKKLKKLMNEVKTSQMEVSQKLEEFKRKSLEKQKRYADVDFLKRMEERQVERLKRRKEVEEKKRKIEEERIEAQREKEEEKRLEEQEYKRKNLEELKEKRRLEKERKERRKKERERLRFNMSLADRHYEKYVLRRYGMKPWVTLMTIRDSQTHRAVAFFESRLKGKVFREWTSKARGELSLKVARADAFYAKALKKKCLFIWVSFHGEKIKQNQVAADWNEFKIIERAFKRWLDFTQDEQMEYLNKKYASEQNYERALKMKFLKNLRSYPERKKFEQAKENQKRKWRQKVKEILPDYQPVGVSLSS